TRLRSSPVAFEQTDFSNPTNSLTINRGNAGDQLTVNALPDLTTALTVGTAAAPFGPVTVAGAVTLAAGKSLAVTASSILVNAAVTTAGGSLSLSATNGLTVNKP